MIDLSVRKELKGVLNSNPDLITNIKNIDDNILVVTGKSVAEGAKHMSGEFLNELSVLVPAGCIKESIEQRIHKIINK